MTDSASASEVSLVYQVYHSRGAGPTRTRFPAATPQHPLYSCRTSPAWPARQWQLAFITTIFKFQRPTFQLRHHGSRGAYGGGSRKFRKDPHGLCRAALARRRRRSVSEGSSISRHQARRRSSPLDMRVVRLAARPKRTLRGARCRQMADLCTRTPPLTRRPVSDGGSNNRHQSTRRHSTYHNVIAVRLAARQQTAVRAYHFSLVAGLC